MAIQTPCGASAPCDHAVKSASDAKAREQIEAGLLRKRFAAGYADAAHAAASRDFNQLACLTPLAAVKGVLRIAVDTPQRTTGQADEQSRPTDGVCFTLDRNEGLRDLDTAHRPSTSILASRSSAARPISVPGYVVATFCSVALALRYDLSSYWQKPTFSNASAVLREFGNVVTTL